MCGRVCRWVVECDVREVTVVPCDGKGGLQRAYFCSEYLDEGVTRGDEVGPEGVEEGGRGLDMWSLQQGRV